MIIRTFSLVVALCIFLSFEGEAKQIALSFDDSPRSANGYLSGPDRAHKLVSALKKHKVEQAAFFAVSQGLDTEGLQRLMTFSRAGHVIANHTHTHPDVNKTDLQSYIKNIDYADKALSIFPTFKKWFRFPYLREGNDEAKRDGIREFLAQNGYLNAYITLNNYDWYLENLFQKAIKTHGHINMVEMKKLYVDIMMEGIVYYDEIARRLLNRSPKHVLLLHETDLSALFIGALVEELRSKNWEIIPIEEAYSDPISQYKLNKVLRFNPGRIGEIAIDTGQTKELWHSSLEESYLNEQFQQRVLNQ